MMNFPTQGKKKIFKGKKYYLKTLKEEKVFICTEDQEINYTAGDVCIDLTLLGLDKTINSVADFRKAFPPLRD